MAHRWTLPGLGLAGLALATPALGAERCMVGDPTGSPLKVRRFDSKVSGVLHDGEIVRVLSTGADKSGKPGAYVALGAGHGAQPTPTRLLRDGSALISQRKFFLGTL
jgi:hypothetical protein